MGMQQRVRIIYASTEIENSLLKENDLSCRETKMQNKNFLLTYNGDLSHTARGIV